MRKVLVVSLLSLFAVGCTWNVADVKVHAKDRLAEFGYEVVAYEGYWWSFPDGGKVWYQVRKAGDPNDIRYSCYLTKWQGEYHLYGPHLIDQGLITAAARQGESPVSSPNSESAKAVQASSGE